MRRSIVAKRSKKKKTPGKKKSAKKAAKGAPAAEEAAEGTEAEALEEAGTREDVAVWVAEGGSGPPAPDGDEGEAESTDTAAEEAGIEEAVAADGDDADEPLLTDEPVDEEEADILSADPAAQLLEQGELHAALEALLFTSPDPLSLRRLCNALGDVSAQEVRDALTELTAEYEGQGRGFRIIEVAGGFQMATQERFAEYILRLGTKKKQSTLSGAMLETLAIIGYRQPVIRAVVESIRGVESSGVVRNLLDLGLIEVVGRKEVIGRPQMYGTTEKFLRSFGLRNLKDLPSIRGLREKLEAEEAEELSREKEARDDAAKPKAEASEQAAEQEDAETREDAADSEALGEPDEADGAFDGDETDEAFDEEDEEDDEDGDDEDENDEWDEDDE